MAQFATALIQQMDDKDAAIEQATALVHAMPAQLEAHWLARFGQKIGLAEATPEDLPLIEDLLQRMAAQNADFTNTFAALHTGKARDQFTDPTIFDAWETSWRDRLASERNPEDVMAQSNPAIIPRNHRIEQMIEAAVADDFAPFFTLLSALAQPFSVSAKYETLTHAPLPTEHVAATFCGT